jgi:hypothetical protein
MSPAPPAKIRLLKPIGYYPYAMPASLFLRYALLPTHFTVLVLVAVVSFGLTLSQYAGLYGLPLELTLLSWLFNYAFVLLEAVANGAREPPVLAIEMLNPFNESRPIFQLVLAIIVAIVLGAVAYFVDVPLAIVLGIAVFVAMPASTGALAIANSVWQAVHPAVLWHIARTLGLSYVVIVGAVLGYGALIWWLGASGHAPMWLANLISIFAWLSIFALIGGALFEHRDALGHEAIDSPELRAARLQNEIDRERNRFLDKVHAQARGGNLAGAWHTLEGELAVQKYSFEYYDWLLDRLEDRDDQRLAGRLAQDYIARALGRDNARAALIAQRGLRADPTFRPRSGAQCLRVAQLLRLSGDRQSAQALLRDFAEHFPGDAAVADAATLYDSLKRNV